MPADNLLNDLSDEERYELVRLLESYRGFQLTYYDDPAGFVRDCFVWSEGEGASFYQNEILGEVQKHKRYSVRGPHGLGKAQPHSLIIDTPNGKKTFGELIPGDYVFGSDGSPVQVKDVFERGEMDVYKVRFNDGSETYCSADHLWTVRKSDWKTNKQTEWEWITLPLSEIAMLGVTKKNGVAKTRKWALPTVEPLQYPYHWIPVDPYTLGAWLGDGGRKGNGIYGNDREVAERIRVAGYKVEERQRLTCLMFYVHQLQAGLRIAGVFEKGAREKCVPRSFLENSVEVRKEVLRGLLDTDGTVTKDGTIAFGSSSLQLASDVVWLTRSLGGIARLHSRMVKYKDKLSPCYAVLLTLPTDRWFYIERKQIRVRSTSQKRYLWRWIDSIELIKKMPVRCISVDAPDGLYVANDCILTHNTTMAAWVILWFALTRDGITDWKIPCTASVWRQLSKFLMPEVHKWARLINWKKIGRPSFNDRTELHELSIHLSTGEAFALASDDASAIEGAHASAMLYVFDESKSIPDAIWDAAEGALTAADARAFAISTPGEPIGRFYSIHSHSLAYADWKTRHVTMEDALTAGRMDRDWIDARGKQWGKSSALYKNRVLGEFAASDEDGIISLSWIERSNERWSARDDTNDWGLFTSLGVDIGRGGDPSVIARKHESAIRLLEEMNERDVMTVTGRVHGILKNNGSVKATIDVIGIGAGVVDRLREFKECAKRIIAFNAGEKTDWKDKSKELEFINKRAASWWHVRELLEADELDLPPNDTLTGELTTPKYKMTSNGRIQVESKDDIKARIGRSTNYADATIMSCWNERTAINYGSFRGAGKVKDYIPLAADTP